MATKKKAETPQPTPKTKGTRRLFPRGWSLSSVDYSLEERVDKLMSMLAPEFQRYGNASRACGDVVPLSAVMGWVMAEDPARGWMEAEIVLAILMLGIGVDIRSQTVLLPRIDNN